jgi:YbgC/YbaW family acyl-CoA thioester hydrolase
MDYYYKLDFTVRDYECDIQGIVNNGVYMNYLEHARHEFLLAQGVDFAALAKQKINLVVVRAELNYKTPLTSGDAFWVGITRCSSFLLLTINITTITTKKMLDNKKEAWDYSLSVSCYGA